ncbi:hypothetical protein UFOVP326_55 [uncultured Caudovirales phage]|uniref:Uncharacterized protein n=1 Tax=uncultured Caudovirales phage TaxID=2100421 RepID=A0A6J5LX64_9CAUD|nr:hypothetical protein UFOVP326_55 [uncultured Caudovirales phage]
MFLFLKAHVRGYTKRDGVFVRPHEDSRPEARETWHGDERHVEEVLALMEHHRRQGWHRAFGLRVATPHHATDDDPPVARGETLPPSYRWKDGEPTNRRLVGTSTIGVHDAESVRRALGLLGSYWGRQVVLAGARSRHRGQDAGEAVLKDPTVLHVWRRKGIGTGRTSWGQGQDHD